MADDPEILAALDEAAHVVNKTGAFALDDRLMRMVGRASLEAYIAAAIEHKDTRALFMFVGGIVARCGERGLFPAMRRPLVEAALRFDRERVAVIILAMKDALRENVSPDQSLHCDFCHAEDPGWQLPHSRFTSSPDVVFEAGAFAACDACLQLLRRGRVDQLVWYVATAFRKRGDATPHDVLMATLRSTFSGFVEHWNGQVKPL